MKPLRHSTAVPARLSAPTLGLISLNRPNRWSLCVCMWQPAVRLYV